MFVLGENHFRKCFSGNAGVWLVRKIEFSGNWFPLTQKKKALTTEMNFHSYFHFKWIPKREREREWEREREKHNQLAPSARPSSSQRHSQAPASSIAIRDRELAFAPIVIGAVLREIAIDGAVVGLELAKHCAVEPSQSRASIWVLCLFFWFCLFPCSIFQTPENFFQKIFWNTTKHIKTFSFPENSISEKWNIFRKIAFLENGIFSGNAFTRTKHSLNSSIEE